MLRVMKPPEQQDIPLCQVPRVLSAYPVFGQAGFKLGTVPSVRIKPRMLIAVGHEACTVDAPGRIPALVFRAAFDQFVSAQFVVVPDPALGIVRDCGAGFRYLRIIASGISFAVIRVRPISAHAAVEAGFIVYICKASCIVNIVRTSVNDD